MTVIVDAFSYAVQDTSGCGRVHEDAEPPSKAGTPSAVGLPGASQAPHGSSLGQSQGNYRKTAGMGCPIPMQLLK